VRVVDQAQQWRSARRVRQQRQRRERHQKPVGHGSKGPPEHHVECLGLRGRQPGDPVEQGVQQLVHRAVAQVLLRLDAGRAQHPHVPCRFHG
jgi:hypothetical protein